jgi:hypothetical protein
MGYTGTHKGYTDKLYIRGYTGIRRHTQGLHMQVYTRVTQVYAGIHRHTQGVYTRGTYTRVYAGVHSLLKS